MKNRAKCKLCGSIIESFHRQDYVTCKCGEIAIDGGADYLKCSAKNFKNFLRVDDLDNEIEVRMQDEITEIKGETKSKLTRKELLDMLNEMIKNIERLPQAAMITPITHSDFVSALMLLLAILQED